MRTNEDGTITDYISALDQDVTFSPEAWARELELREEIKADINDYIKSLEAAEDEEERLIEADKIKHEHLAGISQHDWYQSCYQTNSAVLLEQVTYAVVAYEVENRRERTFTSLKELNKWAGY